MSHMPGFNRDDLSEEERAIFDQMVMEEMEKLEREFKMMDTDNEPPVNLRDAAKGQDGDWLRSPVRKAVPKLSVGSPGLEVGGGIGFKAEKSPSQKRLEQREYARQISVSAQQPQEEGYAPRSGVGARHPQVDTFETDYSLNKMSSIGASDPKLVTVAQRRANQEAYAQQIAADANRKKTDFITSPEQPRYRKPKKDDDDDLNNYAESFMGNIGKEKQSDQEKRIKQMKYAQQLLDQQQQNKLHADPDSPRASGRNARKPSIGGGQSNGGGYSVAAAAASRDVDEYAYRGSVKAPWESAAADRVLPKRGNPNEYNEPVYVPGLNDPPPRSQSSGRIGSRAAVGAPSAAAAAYGAGSQSVFGADPAAEQAKKREAQLAYARQLQEQQQQNQKAGTHGDGHTPKSLRRPGGGPMLDFPGAADGVSSPSRYNSSNVPVNVGGDGIYGRSKSQPRPSSGRGAAASTTLFGSSDLSAEEAAAAKRMQQQRYHEELSRAAAAQPISSDRISLKERERLRGAVGGQAAYDPSEDPSGGGYGGRSSSSRGAAPPYAAAPSLAVGRGLSESDERMRKKEQQSAYYQQLRDDAKVAPLPVDRKPVQRNSSGNDSSFEYGRYPNDPVDMYQQEYGSGFGAASGRGAQAAVGRGGPTGGVGIAGIGGVGADDPAAVRARKLAAQQEYARQLQDAEDRKRVLEQQQRQLADDSYGGRDSGSQSLYRKQQVKRQQEDANFKGKPVQAADSYADTDPYSYRGASGNDAAAPRGTGYMFPSDADAEKNSAAARRARQQEYARALQQDIQAAPLSDQYGRGSLAKSKRDVDEYGSYGQGQSQSHRSQNPPYAQDAYRGDGAQMGGGGGGAGYGGGGGYGGCGSYDVADGGPGRSGSGYGSRGSSGGGGSGYARQAGHSQSLGALAAGREYQGASGGYANSPPPKQQSGYSHRGTSSGGGASSIALGSGYRR